MITQVSCKLTNSLFLYSERQGMSLTPLTEMFEGPEEFLRDPHFWIDIKLCERLFQRATKILGDPHLGATVGSHLVEISAMGALDDVFRLMSSQKDYYTNLPRFFSYFLAPMDRLKEGEYGENYVRFTFPELGSDNRHVSAFLRAALENLPRYTGHPAAHSQWNDKTLEFYINWESAQSSLFEKEPGQVLSPKLMQKLSNQLESTERALQAKNREILNQKLEIEQMRGELQTQVREKIYVEKMTGLAQLAAGVAHEINNPLSYVTSNLVRFEDYFKKLELYVTRIERGENVQDLRKQFDLDFIFSEIPQMLRESSIGLARVKEIVKDLSSLAHPQSGRDESKMLVDLNGILESSLKVFQDEFKNKNIQVGKEFSLRTPVKVFPVRMSQVFMNLISNAIHALPEKGQLDIKTEEKGGSALIEVSDSGEGMDDNVLSRIFTPFFTTKEVGKGTGLGLSIAQSIVEMHKGRIDVSSKKGRGSRFTVTLPLSH